MTKVTMEWNIPEDSEHYELYRKAPDYYACLYDLYQYLRTHTKYYDAQSSLHEETLNEIYTQFWNILSNNDVTIP